jgi:type VI secretion system protein ImpK
MLTRQVRDPQRLTAEGRAEAEPVAPNDTPANRARNRRVEITLLAAPEKSNLK